MKNHLVVRPLPLALACLLWTSLFGQADDWPQWRGPLRDGVWREDGVLERFPPEGPPVRWRTPIGAGFSGPAVASGRVFLRVYALGAMGDLWCLESTTGRVVWQKNFVRDYHAGVPLYGFASAPLADGDRLIVMVGGEGQLVMALDRHSGRELWKAGTASEPGYCAPLIRTLSGRRQLVIWHGDGLAGLEPESGKELWSVPHPISLGIAISTPAIADNGLPCPVSTMAP